MAEVTLRAVSVRKALLSVQKLHARRLSRINNKKAA
jgi:hypothetical protein